MKKTYMKPLAEVLNVQMAQMIAASEELDIVDGVFKEPESDAENRMLEDLIFGK